MILNFFGKNLILMSSKCSILLSGVAIKVKAVMQDDCIIQKRIQTSEYIY
jgi:hypothetical protein